MLSQLKLFAGITVETVVYVALTERNVKEIIYEFLNRFYGSLGYHRISEMSDRQTDRQYIMITFSFSCV